MRVSESLCTSYWEQNRGTRAEYLRKACSVDLGGPGVPRNCARSSALGQFRPDTLRKSWGKFPSCSAMYATLFQICFCLNYHCQTRCQWWGNRRAQGLLLLLFPPKSCLPLKKYKLCWKHQWQDYVHWLWVRIESYENTTWPLSSLWTTTNIHVGCAHCRKQSVKCSGLNLSRHKDQCYPTVTWMAMERLPSCCSSD